MTKPYFTETAVYFYAGTSEDVRLRGQLYAQLRQQRALHVLMCKMVLNVMGVVSCRIASLLIVTLLCHYTGIT